MVERISAGFDSEIHTEAVAVGISQATWLFACLIDTAADAVAAV